MLREISSALELNEPAGKTAKIGNCVDSNEPAVKKAKIEK
jgi:hypothetical protein